MLITKTRQRRIKKAIAVFILFTIINQILTPTLTYALTSGPTAPEATNFEPVDTTDMVNPLTGGFTYNMPLMEVPGPEGGYPLALSYHAGIQPNEEASWVGLGWSLNPGAIARNVNGYPDDWSGAAGLTRSFWNGGTTETYTGGLSIGYGPASINIGLSYSQDTYLGMGSGINIGVGLNLGVFGSGSFKASPFNIGVSVGVDPYGGSYAGANIGLVGGVSGINGLKFSGSLGIATNFNTVTGSANGGVSYEPGGFSVLGATISSSNLKPSLTVGGGEIISANNPDAEKVSTSKHGWSISAPLIVIPVNLNLGHQYVRYWSDNPNPFVANGALYNRTSMNDVNTLKDNDDDNYQLFDPVNTNIVDNPDPLEQLGGTYPNLDNYMVTAQGLGGNMRPYIFSSILYNANRVNNTDHLKDVYGENLSTNAATNKNWQFRFINEFSNSYRQQPLWSADQSYNFDGNPQYGNNDGQEGYDPSSNRLEGATHIEYFTNDEIADSNPTSKAHRRGFIECDAAGFTRPTSANQSASSTVGKQIGGFMITNTSGVTYHYALPVYNANEFQRTENRATANLSNTSQNLSFQYTDLTRNEPYAYTWYLTAITGPDYIARGTTSGKIDQGDWGYWVKFDYGKWTDKYRWRTPSEGNNNDNASPGTTIYSTGVKELYYLNAIETRTHTAIFEKEIRADGKSCTHMDEDTPYQPKAFYYPQSTSCGYIHPQSTLRLNNIYLFQNDQLPMSIDAIRQNSTQYNHTFVYSGCTEVVHYGQNVIDKNDITSSFIGKCLRKTAFNYDYSSSVGCPNSYDPGGIATYVQNPSVDPPTALLGKLTLLTVDFQGKGGVPVTPPTEFQYDLNPADIQNQGNISITQWQSYRQGNNPAIPAIIQIDSPDKFKAGDILTFLVNGNRYYCTLLTRIGTGDHFYAWFVNKPPPVQFDNVPAVKTKNPPYHKDAYDYWGYYKSDYGIDDFLQIDWYPNSDGSYPRYTVRPTTRASNNSTDVWCLRGINTSIGTKIMVNYEGNTYNRSVLSKNKSVIIPHVKGVKSPTPSIHTYTFGVKTMGMDLDQAFKVGDKLNMVFIAWNEASGGSGTPFYGSTDNYPTSAIIQNVNTSAKQITIKLDPQMESNIRNMTYDLDYPLDANLTVNQTLYFGGGSRVKDIVVDDLNNNVKKTSYNYGIPGSQQNEQNSSGVTSYEPLAFNLDYLSYAYQFSKHVGQGPDPTAAIASYRKKLYQDNNRLLSIAREVPGPGVMYEYVTVTDNSILANGTEIPMEGKTVYQYEVFKPEMIGIYDYNNQETIPASGNGPNINGITVQITSQAKKDRSIKDYTSRIGSLKRVITYDERGNKLTEKINHFLHDDLDNTSKTGYRL
jgi:hypothetical protein